MKSSKIWLTSLHLWNKNLWLVLWRKPSFVLLSVDQNTLPQNIAINIYFPPSHETTIYLYIYCISYCHLYIINIICICLFSLKCSWHVFFLFKVIPRWEPQHGKNFSAINCSSDTAGLLTTNFARFCPTHLYNWDLNSVCDLVRYNTRL